MMEHRTTLDPYEQQLLKVFDSYDYDGRGSLDRDGLARLCDTLQLEERGRELISSLLGGEERRATFVEFKDALLALLGGGGNNVQGSEGGRGSPEREVSPKFVYGSKKYGRRSRNDLLLDGRNQANNNNNSNCCAVQRSSSQGDVVLHTKKRKTNSLSKRASFPGTNLIDTDGFIDNQLVCSESMLREAWKKLGVGEDGYLNQTELILVCNAIGLNELANGVLRQISDRLIDDFDHRISFEELLEILQQDDAWVDVINATPANETALNISCTSNDSVFLNSKSVQYITLGPKGNGYINIDTVIELWETAGIASPKFLINDLGFTSNDIDIVELASVLEKEIKGIQDTTRADFANPHVALLQAVLALYQSEIKCLKNVSEQARAEREKLKSDVAEANNRASLLAQEVDDNHAKMEQSAAKQVRLLEQRHSDVLRTVTERLAAEKEQMGATNRTLEERIRSLEAEEARLRADLALARDCSDAAEAEGRVLGDRVAELERARDALGDRVAELEGEARERRDAERARADELLARLAELRLENARLRDRNDEMQAELERGGGAKGGAELLAHGAKRRSDESPSKELDASGPGETSPRLGKVRKFHRRKDEAVVEPPFASSESGFETELDCVDSSLSNASSSSGSESEDLVMRLQAKIDHLEHVLIENAIPLPSPCSAQSETDSALLKVKRLTRNSDDIERLLVDLADDIERLRAKHASDDDARRLNDNFERLIATTTRDPTNDVATETDTPGGDDESERTDLAERLSRTEAENRDLKTKCEELRSCLQQLESEYIECEKYWEGTLEDERKVFEQEQAQYNEHLIRLTDKIAEYEKEFLEKSNRLPPIEEKRKLEEQFTDLEQEYEEYKETTEFRLDEKDREIADLKERLDEAVVPVKLFSSIEIQTDRFPCTLTNHVVESTNLFSSDTLPYVSPSRDQSTQISETSRISSEASRISSESSRIFSVWGGPRSEVETTTSLPNLETKHSDVPSTSARKPAASAAPLRPKRTRKHDKAGQKLYKKASSQGQQEESRRPTGEATAAAAKWNAEEKVLVPLDAFRNMNGRIHHLELRCRQLQLFIKQQHYHAEQVLQHCWQQHRDEKFQLQFALKATQEKLERQVRICNEQLERLARNDVTVKDIYVENAFLVANVQRLEQKCHLLSQCNAANSV